MKYNTKTILLDFKKKRQTDIIHVEDYVNHCPSIIDSKHCIHLIWRICSTFNKKINLFFYLILHSECANVDQQKFY